MNNMDFEELGLLVEQAQNDRDAFGRLVVQFNATVFAIVLRRLGDWDDAQELVQEIWLHVMSRIHQIRQPKRFAGGSRRSLSGWRSIARHGVGL